MDRRSIGVFDSGIGGLTVVKELRKVLPNEDITYFGDVARVPYGSRSPETILRYTMEDIRFLLSKDVKMIIVACGTASSIITDEIIKECPVPIFTVIEPSCKDAVDKTQNGRIAVIGTSATIHSRAHAYEIARLRPQTHVIEQECPLFVPLVESGYTDSDNVAVQKIVFDYLETVRQENPDTVILGCTHYPLLKEAIADFMGENVNLINMGERLAYEVKKELEKSGLENAERRHGNVRYFVSDNAEQFERSATIFLEESIRGLIHSVSMFE